jgi:hypothetical protein
VVLVGTDVSEECIATIFRVKTTNYPRIRHSSLKNTLAVAILHSDRGENLKSDRELILFAAQTILKSAATEQNINNNNKISRNLFSSAQFQSKSGVYFSG